MSWFKQLLGLFRRKPPIDGTRGAYYGDWSNRNPPSAEGRSNE